MTTIPSAVLSQQVRELLSGRRVTAAAFMTYTFEPQFFEEEILPLLTDEAVSIQPKCRLVQMEELLRNNIGPVAVYYDRAGLRNEGAVRLDVRYKPVHVGTGVFHPKVILLLTEPVEDDRKSNPGLICGIMSANLTKNAWWSCLESAHFETANANTPCSFGRDLRSLIEDVIKVATPGDSHDALNTILDFVKRLPADSEQTSRARLRPRIIGGRNALVPFVSNTRGSSLEGTTLEIISPFFDGDAATVLRSLIDELRVRRTFVFLPRTVDGASSCTTEYYDDLREIPRTKWAQFKGEDVLLRLGKDKHAKRRSVHAKVYRFTNKEPAYEALLVGSHNLTTAAHQKGGNFEASFFLEVDPETRIESWLENDDARPELFSMSDPALDDDLAAQNIVIPLQVRFNWIQSTCELLWEGSELSPTLELLLAGSLIVTVKSLPSREWTHLTAPEVEAMRSKLVSSALLTARYDDGTSAEILVQESGMSAKESILLTWSPSDVLAYWSSLTAAQRVHYLERRFVTNSLEGELTAERLELLDDATSSSIFETFAGIFHGFDMLREQVLEGIQANRLSVVDYLLFGNRHDSLPTLLTQIERNEGNKYDAVTRYLYVLSARQVLTSVRDILRSEYPDTLERFRKQFTDVIRRTQFVEVIRRELVLGEDGPAFLEWFEDNFRARVKPAGAVS